MPINNENENEFELSEEELIDEETLLKIGKVQIQGIPSTRFGITPARMTDSVRIDAFQGAVYDIYSRYSEGKYLKRPVRAVLVTNIDDPEYYGWYKVLEAEQDFSCPEARVFSALGIDWLIFSWRSLNQCSSPVKSEICNVSMAFPVEEVEYFYHGDFIFLMKDNKIQLHIPSLKNEAQMPRRGQSRHEFLKSKMPNGMDVSDHGLLMQLGEIERSIRKKNGIL